MTVRTVFVLVFCLDAFPRYVLFFFFNDTATTEIYTLSLHDALPICTPMLDLAPLWISLRIATIATVVTCFVGIATAH